MRPPSTPSELLALAATQEGLVSAAQCDAFGVGERRRRVRVGDGSWVRLARGVYDTQPRVAPDPEGLRRRAAWTGLLSAGPHAIAVGACALALHGVAGLPRHLTPEVALPGASDRTNRSGIRIRQFDNGMTTEPIGSRRAASVPWALAQAVPELPRWSAVAAMDSACNHGLITAAGLDRAHDLARGRRGVARTHEWWSLADGRAESPLETDARLDCVDLGIPPDALQVDLIDKDGRVLGRGDLGWRLGDRRWLIAEIDGRTWHERPEALLHDRRRQNAITASGVAEVLRFTAEDLRRGTVASTIRAYLRIARPSTRC